MLHLEADTEAELTKLIEAAERKYWAVWIRDNTGRIAAALYKPTGRMEPWDDDPEKNRSRQKGA